MLNPNGFRTRKLAHPCWWRTVSFEHYWPSRHSVKGPLSHGSVSGSYNGVVEDYEDGSFSNALRAAHSRLRAKKDSRGVTTQIVTNAYFKTCRSCRVNAVRKVTGELEPRYLCETCLVKWDTGKDPAVPKIHGKIRDGASSGTYRHIEFEKELDLIGKAFRPEGHIGVIYADGNRMSQYLRRIRSEETLGEFSLAIAGAVEQGIAHALKKEFGSSPVWPVVVPICGGDDMVAIVPGDRALKLAVDYLDNFMSLLRRVFPSVRNAKWETNSHLVRGS